MLTISGSFVKVYDFVSYTGIIVRESHDRCQIFTVKQCCNLLYKWVIQILHSKHNMLLSDFHIHTVHLDIIKVLFIHQLMH
jgi:hypothetical protein